MRVVYERRPSPEGAGWLCKHRGGYGGSPLMLSEQKCLREYFTACEITGKELCLSVGLFKKGSNKQHSSSASHADTSWNVREIVRGGTGFIPELTTFKRGGWLPKRATLTTFSYFLRLGHGAATSARSTDHPFPSCSCSSGKTPKQN